jgi:hypothetical protein
MPYSHINIKNKIMPGKTNKSAYAHSGTKKHNKKHSENPKWEHKDRSAGAIIGRAVNTVKNTGEKIGKEAKKVYKDAKKTIEGNKMSPYKLKPVPADKQKSLGKLPTDVRNKMGYQMAFSQDNFKAMNSANKMDSSHSFKMGPANNMKTMYMGSVYSMEDPLKEGTIVVKDDELVKGGDVESYNIPGTTTTKKETIYDTGKSLKGLTQEQLDWRTNEIKKLGGIDEYHKKYGNKETGKAREIETTSTTPDTTGQKQSFESIPQEFDVASNFQRRQQARGVIQSERKQKRQDLKAVRLSGLKGKAKREAKKQIKLEAAQRRGSRIGEINRQQKMQELQGLLPGSTRKIQQDFTSASPQSSDDTRQYKAQKNPAGAPKSKNFKFNSSITSTPSISGSSLGNNLFNKFTGGGTPKPKAKSNIDISGLLKPQMNLSPKAMNYFNRKKK